MADELASSLVLRVDFRTTRDIQLVASVRTLRGRGVAGIAVTIVPVGPGARPLASASTDARGEATLRIATGARATPTDTDLRVRLVATRAGEELAATPVLFSPAADQRIELVVRDDAVMTLSEFDAIAAALQPLLGTRAVFELGTDEVERFAVDADLFPPHLAMFIHAARLAERHLVPATTRYGLLRGGLPSSLPLLLVQGRERFALALRHAHRDGLIPSASDVDQDIETRIAALRALAIGATLEPEPGGDRKVQQALATTTLSRGARQTFVERLVEHRGSLPSLWAALRAGSELSASEIDALEFTITAAALVNHHLPALDGLQALFTRREIAGIRDLAAWDTDRWTLFLDSRGAPDDVPGDTPVERIAAFAESITRIVEDMHPTATLRHRLERDRLAGAAGVAAFLGDNPTFSVTSTIAARYVEANPGAVPAGPDGEQTIANLKAVQRLYQLAPRLQRYDVTRTLLEAGVTSAAEIVHLGVDGFVDHYAAQLDGVHPHLDGRTLARTVFDGARMRHGFAVAMMARHGAAFNDISMTVLSSNALSLEGPGTATLRDLFGSLDYCACEHCRSMYGPAAYLVDLLALLESRPAMAANTSALDVLRSRRPDLTGIELSCINTNTVLPYIDLVLEILEQVAVQQGAVLQPQQTTWVAAELRSGAEHRIAAAYYGPAQAVFPWRLPFDLATERMRAYSQQLGCTWLAAMRALQRDAGGVLEPSRALVVAEAFGMTPLELQLVSNGTAFTAAEVPDTPLDAAWGMSGNASWVADLAENVSELLARSGLTFDELQLVLTLPFVDPNEVVHVQFDQPSCDLGDAHVEGFTGSVADRVHRFVRLWRKTGSEPYALDRTLRVLGGSVLEFEYLERMVALFDVRDRLRASTEVLLGLWAPLDTRSDDSGPSPYHRLFQFQAGQAKLDLGPIDKQILAAQIRVAITESDLANHELQIEQSKAVDEFMRTKFTNEQLYDWMIGQLSAVHFQSYKLAFDLAKKAERALQFELGRDDLTFIEFGAWDSLKKGLLAGEILGQALRRMDAAYLDHDRRRPELSRRFSFRQIDANAVLALQETGSCEFSLPEVLFDLDHPGHYFRRIKAVSVSLPATVGPQSSVGGRLTLLSDWIRLNDDTAPGYPQTDPPHEDTRFAHGPGGVQSIATSRGLDDAGMFQLDFRDERYLPFEGAGVISEWRFELPPVRQFDYRTISDLEIQLQYTAHEGGTAFREAATTAVEAAISTTIDTLNSLGMFMLLSARSDFSTEWERFLRPHEGEESEPLPLPIVLERFPYVARRRGIVVDAVELVFVGPADVIALPSEGTPATVEAPTGTLDVELTATGLHDLIHGAVDLRVASSSTRTTRRGTSGSATEPSRRRTFSTISW